MSETLEDPVAVGKEASRSSSSWTPETDHNGNETETVTDFVTDTEAEVDSEMEKEIKAVSVSAPVAEDVAPVFILQPKEIMKNIDLMKTVAILMENKLQTPPQMIKRLDEELMKDLYSDIQRFPEAFQKFISIIHQIQYLNVTSDWKFTNTNGNNDTTIPTVSTSNSRASIMTRLFGLEEPPVNPALAEFDARKQVLLHLLNTLQQVLNRYLKIQTSLEDRLKRFNELLLIGEQQNAGKNMTNRQFHKCITDSDDDDPNLPLLMRSNRSSHNNQTGKIWLDKFETLNGILRKTKRSSTEVQDSLEVLRDLVLWDHKQAVSNVPPWPVGSEEEGNPTSFNDVSCYNGSVNDTAYVDIQGGGGGIQISHDCQPRSSRHQRGRGRGRMWKISALLAGIVVVLVVVAALSFLRFSY